jgi:hypothetical protein
MRRQGDALVIKKPQLAAAAGKIDCLDLLKIA